MYVLMNLRLQQENKHINEANVTWVDLVMGKPRTVLKHRSGDSNLYNSEGKDS